MLSQLIQDVRPGIGTTKYAWPALTAGFSMLIVSVSLSQINAKLMLKMEIAPNAIKDTT